MLGETPIELQVAEGKNTLSRSIALSAYLCLLDYTFRGITNTIGGIKRIALEKSTIGRIEKTQTTINWDCTIDKSFFVTYGISERGITEDMYVADGIRHVKNNRTSKLVDVTPVWITPLLSAKGKGAELNRKHLISAIEVATEFLTEYRLHYAEGGLTLSTLDGRSIKPSDIGDDESFLLVQLLVLLVNRGYHYGILSINCRGISERLISALVTVAQRFFGDEFIFLYNCPETLNIDRRVLTLPNFMD
jgi:hypothetical protein